MVALGMAFCFNNGLCINMVAKLNPQKYFATNSYRSLELIQIEYYVY